jgi:CBS domain-containing protein
MDTGPLERLDSFPYRHGVAELMSAPVVCVAADISVASAARTMNDRRISSVVVLAADGRAAGIVTERDILRLVAAGRSAESVLVGEAMSAPVKTIEADALVYRALARLARFGIRHLPVIDGEGKPIGMLTSGGLLKQRASLALTLGDEIATAADGTALRAAHDQLAGLARGLRAENVGAVDIAAIVSGVTRDLTARAGELAIAEMAESGRGAPPGGWCLLVLGSAGRAESLLAPDQDNALILDDAVRDDAWFAHFGERLNRLLDEAGVPYCKGGVMAGNAHYRRTLTDWCNHIDGWLERPVPEALLNADIFLDFVPVLGDSALAGALRAHATQRAAASLPFLNLLAQSGAQGGSATDLLGRFRLRDGRLDLKLHGLLPIVAGARVIALAWRVAGRSTDARLAEAAAAGALPVEVAARLQEARATIVEALLGQQLADIEAGLAPGNSVDPTSLKRRASSRLRQALAVAAGMPEIVRDTLSNRPLTALPAGTT